MTPAVQTDRLTHRYGERVALHELTLEINAGEVVALLGPNGSGKTTLFPPREGRATVLGHDLAADAGQRDVVRRKIGVVFQNPALDKQLTAEENLTYHGHLYGLGGAELRGRVRDLLGRVNLLDRAGERVSTFSGGQRRRGEVAKDMLHRPHSRLPHAPST